MSVEERSRVTLRGVLLGALVVYPFSAHYGATIGHWMPAFLVLAGLLLLLAIGTGGWYRLLLVLSSAVVGAVAVLDDGQGGMLLLYGQSVLVNVALCFLFGHTLLDGRRPLINRYMRAIRGELDAPTARYGRRLTQVWTLLFATLSLESVLVAVVASDETWALVTGMFNYLLIAAVFVVEYQVRVRVLSHLTHPGFMGFLLALTRCPLNTVLKG